MALFAAVNIHGMILIRPLRQLGSRDCDEREFVSSPRARDNLAGFRDFCIISKHWMSRHILHLVSAPPFPIPVIGVFLLATIMLCCLFGTE
ncbi:hypothetical protein CDAR_198991 [Caerostris darwini]|uniref:Uncharacterized protein n=1 Tax=Caerostris darwini TaxID=1538125 RepID=A0AAV4T9H1_9ARAC|nr:hypothetical protein CDAR_198991 [Caerostris darwini]